MRQVALDRFRSSEFFDARTIPVIGPNKNPMKNQSQALR
jgi:hypothetical protein